MVGCCFYSTVAVVAVGHWSWLCCTDNLLPPLLIHAPHRLQVTCRKLIPDILGRSTFTVRSFLPV